MVDGTAPVDAVRDLTGGRGADLVFDFVGTDETHADSTAMLARGGTYSVIGYGGMIAIPSAALVGNEQAVVGNLVGTWIDLWELLQLHAAGRVELRRRRIRWTRSTTSWRSCATARSRAAPC